MLTVLMLRRKRYPEIQTWKVPIITLWIAVTGVIGTLILYWIESGGDFGRTSFFGSVLFVPTFALPLLLLGIRYHTLMDFIAPAGCIMLAIMKMDCIKWGCCDGKLLCVRNGVEIYFPSPWVEMFVGWILLFVLIKLEKKPEFRNRIYPTFLILYGIVRYCLNWFRDTDAVFLLGLPPGNFWAFVAIVYGLLWAQILKRKEK